MNLSDEHLSPLAIRRLNREFAKIGKRICRRHQGHPLPMDDAHFYRQSKSQYFETECKGCKNKAMAARCKIRYATDADYRKERSRQAKVDRQRHIERRRETERMKGKRYRQRRKSAKFAAILEGAAVSGGEVAAWHISGQ